MSSGGSDILEKINKDIEKTGFPLEINVMKILLNSGLNVIPQFHYVDPDEGKDRTIDFYCFKAIEVKSEWYEMFRISLFIECKNIVEKPWILFSIKKNMYMNIPKTSLFYLHYLGNNLPYNEQIMLEDLALKTHYTSDRIAINHFIAFKNDRKKDEGKDLINEALNQTTKALKYERGNISRFNEKLSKSKKFNNLILFYPIIICDGNLYEYKVENDVLSPVDYILYQRSGSLEIENSITDIIKLSYLPEFLKKFASESDKIKEILESVLRD